MVFTLIFSFSVGATFKSYFLHVCTSNHVLALKQVPNFPEAQTKEMNHSKQLHIGAALCQSLPSYPPKPPQPCSPKLDENG